MRAPQILNQLLASRAMPQPEVDSNEQEFRGSRYGELMTMNLYNKSHGLAEEGSYFVTTNPAPGTGLATIAAQASFVDTAPFLLLKNNNKAGGKRVILDLLRLLCTAPGTAGTQLRFAIKIDDANPLRYTSGSAGGNAGAYTPQNVNMDDPNQSSLLVYAGPIVAAAVSGSARLLDSGLLRTVIPVIGDTWMVAFGASEAAAAASALNGAVPSFFTLNVAPVVLGPQQWAAIHIWLPSQSAASSFEFSLGHIER